MHLLCPSKIRLAFVPFLVLLGLSNLAYAGTITITSSATPTTVLGPSSDSISMNAGSETVDTSGVFTFQTGDLVIGNSAIPDQIVPFSLEDTITLNGVTQVLTIFGQDSVTTTEDVLSIFAGTPVQFGDEIFNLQPFQVSATSIGEDLPIELQGTLTPEPGTLILLGTGMVGAAAVSLRRRGLPKA